MKIKLPQNFPYFYKKIVDYREKSFYVDKKVILFACLQESYREKKVMEMYGDSPEEARKSIARSDAARRAYYKNVSGKEWGDPHGYELCIDASIGEEAAAALICSYIGGMGGQQEKGPYFC